jgi:hypothetical protein
MNVLVEYPVFIIAPEGFLEKDNLFVELSESDAWKRKEEEEEMTGIKYTIRQGSISLPVTFVHGRPYFMDQNKQGAPAPEVAKEIKKNAIFRGIEVENNLEHPQQLRPIKKKVNVI